MAHKATSLRLLHRACGILGALSLSQAALALDFQYGARVGAAYTDNAVRTPTDEQGSGAAAVGIDLRGVRSTGRLQYDVYGDLEYRDYFETGIESQEYGRLVAVSSYAFLPERFDWLLSGSFDQIREDLLRPSAPGNLEDVITVSTGPRFTGRFMDAMEVQADAHYSIAEYSRRDADNVTIGGVLTLGRRISERSYIGLGGSYDDVNYSTPPGVIAPDFDRREYFVRFTTEGLRTEFRADVGYSEISGEGIDANGPLARVRLDRKLTPFVTAFVGYTREFPTSDEAAFTPAPAEGGLVQDASLLTAGPRENESLEVGLTMTRSRTGATLVYARRHEEELGVLADRTFDTVSLWLSRALTTRSSVRLFGIYSSEEIVGLVGSSTIDAEATTFGGELNVALGRSFTLDFRVERSERDSDLDIGAYDEMSGGVYLRYGSSRQFGQ